MPCVDDERRQGRCVALGASGTLQHLRWQCNDDRPSDPHKTVVLPARGHLNRHRIAVTLSTSQHGQQCAPLQGHHNSQAVGCRHNHCSHSSAEQRNKSWCVVHDQTLATLTPSNLHAPQLMHDIPRLALEQQHLAETSDGHTNLCRARRCPPRSAPLSQWL